MSSLHCLLERKRPRRAGHHGQQKTRHGYPPGRMLEK
jgi:hypothetical protein